MSSFWGPTFYERNYMIDFSNNHGGQESWAFNLAPTNEKDDIIEDRQITLVRTEQRV